MFLVYQNGFDKKAKYPPDQSYFAIEDVLSDEIANALDFRHFVDGDEGKKAFR